MSAHDVRHLCCCMWCGELADKRQLIGEGKEYSHGRCFALKFGSNALLALPSEETDKLTLGDIGTETMRCLLDRRTKL